MTNIYTKFYSIRYKNELLKQVHLSNQFQYETQNLKFSRMRKTNIDLIKGARVAVQGRKWFKIDNVILSTIMYKYPPKETYYIIRISSDISLINFKYVGIYIIQCSNGYSTENPVGRVNHNSGSVIHCHLLSVLNFQPKWVRLLINSIFIISGKAKTAI